MRSSTDAALQDELLVTLYQIQCDHGYGAELCYDEWARETGQEIELIRRAAQILEERGLAASITAGPSTSITSAGVNYVEKNRLANEQQIHENQMFRTKFMDELSNVRDEFGPLAGADWRSILADRCFDPRLFEANYKFLVDCGAMEHITMSTVRATAYGHGQTLEYRNKVRLVNELDSLKKATKVGPQRRGHNFEALLAQAAAAENWRVVKNSRPRGEEIDLILSRSRSYFVASCKWEKSPVGVPSIRDLRERVTHRASSRGILFSMSGFTATAEALAHERLDSAVILLFGPNDCEWALAGKLTELIESKLHQAMVLRELPWK